ncbi:fimbrillin family protein [uncultured Bacteroides sp.]|uniref:fimbrillin family protein n=1 Tax=uncultured Bacteroides sp. TaxID=162156 RepID=UPI0025F3CC36|nr:fimbrillin family protein [uncultured Bacteroides sp.]
MKAFNKLFITAIATMAMSACNNELSEQQANNSGIINFRMGIGTPASSRIAMADDNYSATFAAGDEVGIFVKDNDSYTNVKYTTADGTNWTGGPIKAPAEGAYNYTFYAYYPYSGEVTDASAITTTVATDQETNGYIKNDFLISTAETSNTTVTLPFSHALSLVEVLLTGNGAAEGATVNMLNVATDATIDLTTSTVTTGETKANVTMDALTGVAMKYRAIVPEQEISANTSIFKIVSDGITYEASYKNAVKFEKGKYLAMIITLGEGGTADIEITTGATINDWTEGDGGDTTTGITEMEIPLPTDNQFTSISGNWSASTASQQIPQTATDGWYKRNTGTTAGYDAIEEALTITTTADIKGAWNSDNVTFHTQTPFEQGYYTLSFDVKASEGVSNGIVGTGIASSNDNKLFQIVNSSWADWQRTVTTFGSLTGDAYVTKTVNLNFSNGSTTGKSSNVTDFSGTETTDVNGGINIIFYNYTGSASTLYIKNIKITKAEGPSTETTE